MQIFDDNYSFLKENRNAELVLYSVKGGREEQQDCSGYEIADDRLMAVICDGMGGENDGKKASNTAVGEFLNQYLLSENDGKPDDFLKKRLFPQIRLFVPLPIKTVIWCAPVQQLSAY